MELRYAVVPCPLGRLLVAATERGIAAVYLGDSERRLRGELGSQFPGARIREDRKGLGRQAAEAIARHLRGRQALPDWPLDLRATAFQRRVWEELRRIPCGATRSYGEIAEAIGKPRAARAVARACATNPASIVIPCHRVVGKDGALAGYRWGLGRKRALLEMETANVQGRGRPAAPRRASKPRTHQNAQPARAHVSTIRAKRFAETR
ncbi:MAG TPA: methylated-DNA--[protein]-cysteine S-methyltransferase [Patescibacteria group bacterium]|nr:methylated-DNA--[protein]-cysteine S-methyltransferase [Patescibacteria group bacterium]